MEPTDLVLVESALVGAENPLLVYIGGLDAASRPTMSSAARRIVREISDGRILDPVKFPWHKVNYSVVKRLRAIFSDQGFAPRTVNKSLALIRGIVREAWLLNLCSHEQYQGVCEVGDLKSNTLPAGRVVERAEIASLLAVCRGTDNGLRDGALISILVGAGLREKETTLLLRGDYDMLTGVIRVLHGKQHKQRQAYLMREFDEPIKHYLERVPGFPGDPFIVRIAPNGVAIRPLQKISTQAVHVTLAKRAKEAGVAAFTPHDLRRTFITNQLGDDNDPLRVARAVGHESPKTTMIYDRRTAESDRLAIRKEIKDL